MRACTEGGKSWTLTALQQIAAELAKADSCKGLLMKLWKGDKTVTSDELRGEGCRS